jgi:hypothetical protein
VTAGLQPKCPSFHFLKGQSFVPEGESQAWVSHQNHADGPIAPGSDIVFCKVHACEQTVDLTEIKFKVSSKTQNCTIRSSNSAGKFVEHILLGCPIPCPESAAKALMTSVNLVQIGFAGSAVAPATYYDEGKYVGDFVDREFLLVALKDVPSASACGSHGCLFEFGMQGCVLPSVVVYSFLCTFPMHACPLVQTRRFSFFPVEIVAFVCACLHRSS